MPDPASPAADLRLLTAGDAAAMLHVDPKTFRRMNAPFILAGNSKRYTEALLKSWLERRTQQCPTKPRGQKPGKSQGKNTSKVVPIRRTGRSASASSTTAFERVAGPKTG